MTHIARLRKRAAKEEWGGDFDCESHYDSYNSGPFHSLQRTDISNFQTLTNATVRFSKGLLAKASHHEGTAYSISFFRALLNTKRSKRFSCSAVCRSFSQERIMQAVRFKLTHLSMLGLEPSAITTRRSLLHGHGESKVGYEGKERRGGTLGKVVCESYILFIVV